MKKMYRNIFGTVALALNRTTRKTGSKKVVCALVIACALAMTAITPALADEKYACRCKGIKYWILFVPSYGNCGNGFAGDKKGNLITDISGDDLRNYIPVGVSKPLTSGDWQCGYYPDSGWNCAKMSGSSLPPCINDRR